MDGTKRNDTGRSSELIDPVRKKATNPAEYCGDEWDRSRERGFRTPKDIRQASSHDEATDEQSGYRTHATSNCRETINGRKECPTEYPKEGPHDSVPNHPPTVEQGVLPNLEQRQGRGTLTGSPFSHSVRIESDERPTHTETVGTGENTDDQEYHEVGVRNYVCRHQLENGVRREWDHLPRHHFQHGIVVTFCSAQ
jgi:hypothetical protein